MGFEPGLLFQGMTFALIRLLAEGDADPGLDVAIRGNALRLRVRKSTGEVLMTVYGEAYDEAGDQLVLACLQRLGVERLRKLHKTPLRKGKPLTLV